MPEGVVLAAPLEEIDIFKHQSRTVLDDQSLHDLAADIKTHGQLQAGLAWHDEGRGRLILICGERRFRALKLAGLPTMDVKVIRGKLTQAQLLEMNIAENLQRASLNPIERGNAFARMMQLEGITARDVAIRLHVSDAMVSRDLSLLNLSTELQARVASGEIPSTVGSSLARLADDETRRYLSEQYSSGALSREGVAREVNQRLGAHRKSQTKPMRLSVKLEDGIVFTVSSTKPPTPDILLRLCEHLKREAKKLEVAQATPVKAS